MRLIWTGASMEDRKTIFDYITADNPRAAIAMDDLFVEKARLLLDHPNLGRIGRVPGTREYVAHRSYLLIYERLAEEIRILRVLHGARRWPPREDR